MNLQESAETAKRHHEDEKREQEADHEAPLGGKVLHPPGDERGQSAGETDDPQGVPGLLVHEGVHVVAEQ